MWPEPYFVKLINLTSSVKEGGTNFWATFVISEKSPEVNNRPDAAKLANLVTLAAMAETKKAENDSATDAVTGNSRQSVCPSVRRAAGAAVYVSRSFRAGAAEFRLRILNRDGATCAEHFRPTIVRFLRQTKHRLRNFTHSERPLGPWGTFTSIESLQK
jgi:hypothetical protein